MKRLLKNLFTILFLGVIGTIAGVELGGIWIYALLIAGLGLGTYIAYKHNFYEE